MSPEQANGPNLADNTSGSNPIVASEDSASAHQILPPVMFTPEVNSGTSSEVSPASVTDNSSPNNAGNAAGESIASNMFTQDQVELPSDLDESQNISHNTQGLGTYSNEPGQEQTEDSDSSHDIQTQTTMVVYSCNDDADPRMNSMPIDIPFEYEAYISSKIDHIEAMKELKTKIVQDVGNSLGCNISSFRRSLRYKAEFEVISGFQLMVNTFSDVNSKWALNDCRRLYSSQLELIHS